MDNKGNANIYWDQDLKNKRLYLIRYSEIGLKGKSTRNSMELRLIKNMKFAIRKNNIHGEFYRERGRIYAITDLHAENSLENVMGIKSFSEVFFMTFKDPKEIISEVTHIFSEKVSGKTFASRVRRSGNHNFTSIEMDRMIGDALFSYSAGIDLTEPDVEIQVEIRDNRAYIIKSWFEGPGGLPLGTEGRMISLVSGGIDSPVATWMMMRRGSPADMLFISMAHPVDTVEFLKAAGKLYDRWYNGYDPDIYILDITRLMDQYLFRGKMRYGNVSFKKFIYNMAEKFCIEKNYCGIITGESSGQVSSQTPENLMELSRGMTFPVHRPLIGMDKDWIISKSREIGTFESTSLGDFCSLFSETPITKIKKEELEHDMKNIASYDPLENEIIRIKGSQIKSFIDNLSFHTSKDVLPSNAVYMDMRDIKSYDAWHPEGAIHTSPVKIGKQIDSINKEQPVILYCKKGLQSAHFASRLRKLGFDAYFTDEKTVMKHTLKPKNVS